ncbi:response regulator [Pedobacter sp. P351]|uniref:response regulator n=1 Tax=Pedobacter superstes TaxID=3133441 RepID=UPI0030A2E80D
MGSKVLVMDDDDLILEVLKEALSYENFQVETGGECLNILKTVNDYNPDVILIDYLIGKVNGGELCHQLKSNPSTRHIPVIIMSAYPRVFESLGNYGCNSFIPKPFSLDQLVETINRVRNH